MKKTDQLQQSQTREEDGSTAAEPDSGRRRINCSRESLWKKTDQLQQRKSMEEDGSAAAEPDSGRRRINCSRARQWKKTDQLQQNQTEEQDGLTAAEQDSKKWNKTPPTPPPSTTAGQDSQGLASQIYVGRYASVTAWN